MKMNFEWEEIYNNSGIKSCSFFESTFRAKVIGGWLIRHTTSNDFQYSTDNLEDSEIIRHIADDGWQNVSSVISFVSDPNHEWEIEV